MSAPDLLKKLAVDHYDTLSLGGGRFDKQDVIDLVLADAALDGLADELLDFAAEKAVGDVDRNRTRRDQNDDQQTLFGDSDRTLALGTNERRRKGACDLDDISRHMAIVMANAARVAESASREQREFSLLLPYLKSGHTWETSARKYLDENEDSR